MAVTTILGLLGTVVVVAVWYGCVCWIDRQAGGHRGSDSAGPAGMAER